MRSRGRHSHAHCVAVMLRDIEIRNCNQQSAAAECQGQPRYRYLHHLDYSSPLNDLQHASVKGIDSLRVFWRYNQFLDMIPGSCRWSRVCSAAPFMAVNGNK